MKDTAEMPPPPSGEPVAQRLPVARVANLNMILGATEFFGYSCLLLIMALVLEGFRGPHAGPAEQGPVRRLTLTLIGILAVGGLLKMVAGWGLRARRRWGRTLTLILGGLAGLLALGLAVMLQIREHSLEELFRGRIQAGFPFLVPLAYGSYAATVFASLWGSKSAAELS